MFTKTNSQSSSSAPEPRKAAPKAAVGSVPSILAPDLIVTGDLKSDGEIQIDGRHEGNVVANKVTIGENGAINGTISAKNVYIRGKATGKIKANIVELSETANVQADIAQDQLTIANGAFFDGKCSRMSKAAPAPAPLKPTAKKPV